MLNKHIVDVRQYAGNWQWPIPEEFINDVCSVKKFPHDSYCFDVAFTLYGVPVLLEVNRGRCFGSYGLNPRQYAEIHLSYWTELWKKNP